MGGEFRSVSVSEIGDFSVEIEAKMGDTRQVSSERASVVQTDGAPKQDPIAKDDQEMPSRHSTRSPAFQFYPKDFLSSSRVQRMSLTEVGVYIVLLSHAWLAGGIPTEPNEIAKIVKVPAVRFAKMWRGALSECFVKRGNVLINERLDKERRKQLAFREKQAAFGKKGGRRVALPDPSSTLKGSVSPRGLSHYGESNLQSADSPVLEKEERLDVAFLEFQAAYPGVRRKGGFLIQQAFMDAAHKSGGPSKLMAALENHVASEQWSNPRLIPGMDLWLKEERWRQVLPAAGAATSSANNPKTAGNIPALQRFIDRGRPA